MGVPNVQPLNQSQIAQLAKRGVEQWEYFSQTGPPGLGGDFHDRREAVPPNPRRLKDAEKEVITRTLQYYSADPRWSDQQELTASFGHLTNNIKRTIENTVKRWGSVKPIHPAKAASIVAAEDKTLVDTCLLDAFLYYSGTPDGTKQRRVEVSFRDIFTSDEPSGALLRTPVGHDGKVLTLRPHHILQTRCFQPTLGARRLGSRFIFVATTTPHERLARRSLPSKETVRALIRARMTAAAMPALSPIHRRASSPEPDPLSRVRLRTSTSQAGAGTPATTGRNGGGELRADTDGLD